MDVPFFLIHSQIEEHLGCFQFFMIVNKAHTKFMYRFLCEYIFFCLLDKYLGMELLGYMVNVYYLYKNLPKVSVS